MSVLIKDMAMPTRCCECRLSTCHSFKERPLCDVLVEYMSYGEWEAKRLDNCPLVSVPLHGDLIDRDALTISTAVPLDGKPYQYVHIDNVKGAPAVIKAEVGE